MIAMSIREDVSADIEIFTLRMRHGAAAPVFSCPNLIYYAIYVEDVAKSTSAHAMAD